MAQPTAPIATTPAAAGSQFTGHQLHMMAASLMVDGSARNAALGAIAGHVSEFTYAGDLAPISPLAVQRDDARTMLEAMIRGLGIELTIVNLLQLSDYLTDQ